jgi:hypothetical protein
VVLSGHEHPYERIQPQNGIYYFILGSSGKLRPSDFRPSSQLLMSFDKDRAFLLVEIAGDEWNFQAISWTGKVVDSGVLARPGKKARSVGAP